MTLDEAMESVDILAAELIEEARAATDGAQQKRLADIAGRLTVSAISGRRWISAERLTVRTAALNILRATGDYEDGAK